MEKILVILNRFAKGEKASRTETEIRALSTRIVLRVTDGPGDAEAMAERAVEQGYKTVVAAGGDGTINQVVNGIAGAEVSLGLLPVGTMNVFSTELGIPSQIKKAWAVIEAAHTREIDLACANDQYFVQLAGVGLDAQIVQETDYRFRKNFGPVSYLVSAAQIAARKPPRIRVSAHGLGEEQGCFVLVGNGRYYGGPFVIFKNACYDDGLLDVLIFKNLGYIDIIRYLQGIVFGTHLEMKDITYFQARSLRVESSDPVPVEVDGEVIGVVPMEFTIANKPLRVIVPKK